MGIKSLAESSYSLSRGGKFSPMNIEARLKDYFFFHTIELGGGLSTPGYPVSRYQRLVMDKIAANVKGKSVIDIGCANGLLSFHAEKCGASRVLAVDNMARELAVMNDLLIPHFKSRVETKLANVLTLTPEDVGKFDVVICTGLLYHLRYPFWSLRIIRDLLIDGGTLILETAAWGDSNRHALLFCPSGIDTPYGPKSLSCSFFNAKALTETLSAFGFKSLSTEHTTPKYKAFLQAVVRTITPSYTPIRRTVFVCALDLAAADKNLEFYEGTKTSLARFQPPH
jgi:SAM-dependent methyltransferase